MVHPPASAKSRIVSLVPSLTELLLDLGLDAQLVGRTGYCIHPQGLVERIAKVGGTKTVNLEKIRRLAPDYVVLNRDENTLATADALREFVPHLVVTHPMTLTDNIALFDLFGSIFGQIGDVANKAQQMSETLRRGLTDLCDLGGEVDQRVLYLIWKDPWMTVSPQTYIADVLSYAGATTVQANVSGANPRYPSFSLANVAWENCDRVLLSTEPYSFTAEHVKALQTEIATLSGRVLPCGLIDGELMSWFGSRSLKTLAYCAALRAAWAKEMHTV